MNGKHTTLLDNLTIHMGDEWGIDVSNNSKCFADCEYEYEEGDVSVGQADYFHIHNLRLIHPCLMTYEDFVSIMISTDTDLCAVLTQKEFDKIEEKIFYELRAENELLST